MTKALIAGIGNPLFSDDGFGPALVDWLETRLPKDSEVELLDAGTSSMALMAKLTEVDWALLIDVVETGDAPGTLVDINAYDLLDLPLGIKLTPHQADLSHILHLLRFEGTAPKRLHFIGVTPKSLELGHGLSPVIESCLDTVGQRALELTRTFHKN